MKVKHLIRELQKSDPDAEVITEGGFYENGLRFFDNNTLRVHVRHDEDGHKVCIRSHVVSPYKKQKLDSYDNKQDTPHPLPEIE